MKRHLATLTIVAVVVAAPAVADPNLEQRVADLESKVAHLESLHGIDTTTTTTTSTTTTTTTTVPPTTTTTSLAPGPSPIIVSGDHPAGFTVPADQTWRISGDVTAGASVIVEGRLELDPGDSLTFTGIDESTWTFTDNPAADTGLWVRGSGVLHAEGPDVVPWTRTKATADTWDPTDEIVVAPSALGDFTFAPYTGEIPSHGPYPTEVLNLTRDCLIAGTPTGYTHVHIASSEPSTIRNCTIRYAGVPAPTTNSNSGRYPLHFHLQGDGSRGTLVENVVVRDSKSHAFVAHGSHGVTYRGTIAYNVSDTPYWWDGRIGPPNDVQQLEVPTDDHTIEFAVAALVKPPLDGKPFRTAGFRLGKGSNVSIAGSVGVAVMTTDADDSQSVFHWPEGPQSVWRFTDNVAHNSAAGAFIWQNTVALHVQDRFVAYANTRAGIDQGAYNARYLWRSGHLLGNGVGIIQHASGKETPGEMAYEDFLIEGSAVGVQVAPFKGAQLGAPVVFGVEFRNVAVGVQESAGLVTGWELVPVSGLGPLPLVEP